MSMNSKFFYFLLIFENVKKSFKKTEILISKKDGEKSGNK